MIINKVTIFILILSTFFISCASRNVQERDFIFSSPVMPRNIDIKTKQKYIKHIGHVLTIFNKVVSNTKNYHPNSNYQDLTYELDRYVNIYVSPILTDHSLDSDLETKLEIAKLYLVIISLYHDIGDNWQAGEYLKLFHSRYENDKHMFDMTLNPMDIGYPTVGEGVRELEKKVYRARRSLFRQTM